MEYPNLTLGRFLARPNRFIAQVEVEGRTETVHVKNTGRCRELLIPGAQVCLVESDNPARKTRFDLVAVWKGERLVNLDAQVPNQVFAQWIASSSLFGPGTAVRPEFTHGDSRFDFRLETPDGQIHLVEVKGVTLEEENVAYFPDAPTQRGVKHLKGLTAALEEGYRCWAVFVVQMEGIDCFRPNDRTHPQFGQALREAQAAGVRVLALGCSVTPGGLEICYEIPAEL